MTYRERALLAEARVAELEDELKGWRASWLADLRGDLVAEELERLTKLLRRHLPSGRAPMAARAICALCAAPDRVRTHVQLLSVVSRKTAEGEDDADLKVIPVAVVYARRALARIGFPGVIETVWGRGYRMAPEPAAAIAALFRRSAA